MFRRRGRAPAGRVQLVDVPSEPTISDPARLRRIVAEALIVQDEALEVLAAVGRGEHLGLVAPRAGPLVHRFFTLREQLPAGCDDPRLGQLAATVDTILYHHAMQVATALDFLAVEWRSAQMARQVASIGGLGPAADLLEDVYAELKRLP